MLNFYPDFQVHLYLLTEPPVDLPFNCDFEDADVCGMLQPEDDDFDWTFSTQATPTGNTGPSSARHGTGFVFIESSDPQSAGDYAS